MKSVRMENVLCDFDLIFPMQDGNTPLHHASSRGHTELCKLLLRAKADVEAKDKVRDATR